MFNFKNLADLSRDESVPTAGMRCWRSAVGVCGGQAGREHSTAIQCVYRGIEHRGVEHRASLETLCKVGSFLQSYKPGAAAQWISGLPSGSAHARGWHSEQYPMPGMPERQVSWQESLMESQRSEGCSQCVPLLGWKQPTGSALDRDDHGKLSFHTASKVSILV